MAQKDLIPMNQRSAEEQKILSSKGGKASQKKQREIKTFKEACRFAMEMSAAPNVREALIEKFPGLEEEKITGVVAMAMAQTHKAMHGDTEAFKVVRDTAGEKPIDKNETNMSENSLKALAQIFGSIKE